jgi:outer membrane protein OmpA-like peptidoglycan-associated protein
MTRPFPIGFSATALAVVLAAGAPFPVQSQTVPATQLTPPRERTTDEAIAADQRGYERLQNRIKALNDRGRPVRDYHLSKAQCWLDVSFHEYHRNDRSAFPQEALSESEKLIVGMERGVSPLPMDTPRVNGAALLRQDLWDAARELRGHAGFRCAAQKVACAEVELVHAGNEFNQQQWRHAKPYVQIAEDLLGEARDLAERCMPPPPPPPPPAPPPVEVTPPVVVPAPVVREAPPAPPPVQIATMQAIVLFNFDRHQPEQIRPFSIVQLEELVRKAREPGVVIEKVVLSGHADRLNSTGESDYNQRLSERRSQTVREMLVKLGIDNALISTGASGDSQQVVGCEARFKGRAELQECLLPNRRVEVTIATRRR